MSKNNINQQIKASIYSGIIEVVITHPLDYTKTIIQNKQQFNLKQYIKNPFVGLSSRIIGIVPMRILFWNSLSYFQSKNYHPVSTGLLTAIIQTSIDYPIEQIKIQKILNNNNLSSAFKQKGLFQGYIATLSRNSGFAIILQSIINSIPKNNQSNQSNNYTISKQYYYGAIGGFTGALLTHPFDSLKTWYQKGNSSFPYHWTIKDYYKGWYFRCGISLISMNIGYIIFNYYQKNC